MKMKIAVKPSQTAAAATETVVNSTSTATAVSTSASASESAHENGHGHIPSMSHRKPVGTSSVAASTVSVSSISPGLSARAAAADPHTCELLLYDDIGAGFWSDGITAKTVRAKLDSFPGAKKAVVRINSPGGEATEGCAIHAVLRGWAADHPDRQVHVKVDGIAASAASVIAMAGDTVTMSNGSMMMVHCAWARSVGYADDLRKTAEALDCISNSMANIYSAKSGMPAEDCMRLMKAETWLTAGDCIDRGLANDIFEEDDDEQTDDGGEGRSSKMLQMAKNFKLLAFMKNVPEQIRPAASILSAADRAKFGFIHSELADIARNLPEISLNLNLNIPQAAAIPAHSTATVDSAWDGPANESRLKNDQGYSYYRKAYAWVDGSGDRTKKSSYKFPHHMVSEGGDVGAANVKACQSGIAVLNGGRGGTKIPAADKKGVYNHLAKHLKDAKVEPPEYKGDLNLSDPEHAELPEFTSVSGALFALQAGLNYGYNSAPEARVAGMEHTIAIRQVGNAKIEKGVEGVKGVEGLEGVGAQASANSSSSVSISGTLAPYNSATNLGEFQEVFVPGCFSRWLARNPDYRILYSHNPAMVLGRKSSGTARMQDTQTGLAYSVVLPETSYAKDLAVLVDRKDVTEASVAMWVIKQRWESRDGIKTRFIEEAALLEGSVVPFGAYTDTTAEIEEQMEQTAQNEHPEVADASISSGEPISSSSSAYTSSSQSSELFSEEDFDFDLDVRMRQYRSF